MNRSSLEFRPRWYHRKRAIISGAGLGLVLVAGAPVIADALTNPPSAEEVKALEETAKRQDSNGPKAIEANQALSQAQGAEASPNNVEGTIRGLGILVVITTGACLVTSIPAGREFVGLNTPNTTGPQ